MNNKILSFGVALMGLCLMASCGGKDKGAPAGTKDNALAAKGTTAVAGRPNYRFVNMDSIFLKYNLSIDFTEQMLRHSNNYDAERKKKIATLTTRSKTLEKQYQNIENSRVQLPSEVEAFQKDLADFQNQSNRAQQELAEKEMQLEQMQAQNLQTVMDSVQNFLKYYGESRGYDAIFYQAGYYNPALDITNEVIEGLNARYNKVK